MEASTENKFRAAMRRLTSTVAIVTARGDEDTGVVMTSATSLCMEPPSLLVAVNKSSSAYAAIMTSQKFRVNMLHREHDPLIGVFSGKLKGKHRFQLGSWSFESDGARLEDAVASIGCVSDGHFEYGSHAVFVGLVTEVMLGDTKHTILWREGGPAFTDEKPPQNFPEPA